MSQSRPKVTYVGSPTRISTELSLRYPTESRTPTRSDFDLTSSISLPDNLNVGSFAISDSLDLAVPQSAGPSPPPRSQLSADLAQSSSSVSASSAGRQAPSPPPAAPASPAARGATSAASGRARRETGEERRQNELLVNTPAAKQDWLENELQFREDEYVEKEQVDIFVGTWNVNGKKPPDSLAPWLLTSATPAHVYAIGLQELDLTAGALIAVETAKAKVWEVAMLQALNEQPGAQYDLLLSKQLVGMLLVVAVRRDQMQYIKDARDCVAPVGILGVMGNKGAVSVRFQYHDTTLCFVNSHLSAHQTELQRRNQDYREISRLIQFSTSTAAAAAAAAAAAGSSGPGGSMSRSTSFSSQRELATTALRPVRTSNGTDVDMWTIFSHHHIFWFGDLNYRIDLSADVLRQAIARQDWALLRTADQLLNQREQGQIFDGFKEGVVEFAPTYKYDYMSTNYDTSEKARLPAWTDRVLWKGNDIALRSYGRFELMTSDHRPVAACFSATVKTIVPARRLAIWKQLVKRIDQLENDFIPNVKLSEKEIQFGDVEYMTPKTRTVTVTNIGFVAAHFSFVPKNEQTQLWKPWLSVSPDKGVLAYKEQIDLQFTINVGQDTASPLNLQTEKLSDILILRLERGRDEYLVVSGNYMVSSFGSPLEHLIRFPGPIRTSEPVADTDALLPMPKELWLLADCIYRHGLDTPGLFVEPGSEDEIKYLRTCLDTGIALDSFAGSVHSVAAAFLALLSSFPQSVVPQSCFDRVVGNSDSTSACFDIVKQFPPLYYNVFHYTMCFLRAVLENQPALSMEQLAVVFAPALIRSPSKKLSDVASGRRVQFLYHFLVPEGAPVPPPPIPRTPSMDSPRRATSVSRPNVRTM